MQSNQRKADLDHTTYDVIFPTNLTEDRPKAFLNALDGALTTDAPRGSGRPTVVFETIGTARGITHRTRFPSYDREFLEGQLDGHIDGIEVTPTPDDDEPDYTFAIRVYMTDPYASLRISSTKDHSTKILKAIQTDHPDERVTLQWIVAHSDVDKEVNAASVPRPSFTRALIFGAKAPEPTKRGQTEQTFVAVGRIAAVAPTQRRAEQLAAMVLRALQSENGTNKIYAKPIRNLTDLNTGATPTRKLGNLLTITELTALLGWPIGDPAIPGLRQGAARRFPATDAIAREGWVFGHSDVPGRRRPIALGTDWVTHHVALTGGPGTGKTSFMSNGVLQLVEKGLGVVVFDAGTDISTERLYYRVLNSLPMSRRDDVVLINPAGDTASAVSINLLDQDLGSAVVDIVEETFASLYPSIMEGVAFRELLRYGLKTLIEAGGYTLLDLAALLKPKESERQWAKELIESAVGPDIRDFWSRNPGAIDPSHKTALEWNRKVETVLNKLWQLTDDPAVRNLLGQTKSTVKLKDLLATNKVVLVSFGGMPPKSAQLLGNLLTNSLWRCAQVLRESDQEPDKPNIMLVDEFQIVAGQETLADILARGRALKFSLVLATQFITRPTISNDLQVTVLQNARTQIVFGTSGREASLWAQQLGRGVVSDTDISRLLPYHGIARLVNESSPVTFTALKPPTPNDTSNVSAHVQAASQRTYGRPVAGIRAETEARRRSNRPKPPRRPQGERPIDDDEE